MHVTFSADLQWNCCPEKRYICCTKRHSPTLFANSWSNCKQSLSHHTYSQWTCTIFNGYMELPSI